MGKSSNWRGGSPTIQSLNRSCVLVWPCCCISRASVHFPLEMCSLWQNTFSQAPLVWWKGLHRAGPPSSNATCCQWRPNEQKLTSMCFCLWYTCIALAQKCYEFTLHWSLHKLKTCSNSVFHRMRLLQLANPGHPLLRNGGWMSAAIRCRRWISAHVSLAQGPNPLDESTLGPWDRCDPWQDYQYSITCIKMHECVCVCLSLSKKRLYERESAFLHCMPYACLLFGICIHVCVCVCVSGFLDGIMSIEIILPTFVAHAVASQTCPIDDLVNLAIW